MEGGFFNVESLNSDISDHKQVMSLMIVNAGYKQFYKLG